MSLTDLLFGSTLKHAKREALTYDPELGGRQKDLGDYLGDFFTGQGAALDKATQEQYINGLKSTYQTKRLIKRLRWQDTYHRLIFRIKKS